MTKFVNSIINNAAAFATKGSEHGISLKHRINVARNRRNQKPTEGGRKKEERFRASLIVATQLGY